MPTSSRTEDMTIDPPTSTAADSSISTTDAIAYWTSTTADVNGMLGGYPQVSRIDIQGSSNFLAKLRKIDQNSASIAATTSKPVYERAVDCGAGIGRITLNLLVHHAKIIDIVEPVKKFTDALEVAVQKGIPMDVPGRLGKIYNVGLEDFDPTAKDNIGYDLIWNQWCVGQLTDAQLVSYLQRCASALHKPHGWIIVKENMSSSPIGEDVFDDTDSSVTRSDASFRKIFEKAGLVLKLTEVQRGFPKELFPVRSYALRPKAWK